MGNSIGLLSKDCKSAWTRSLSKFEEARLINPEWNFSSGTSPVDVGFVLMSKHAMTEERVMNSAASANWRPGQDLVKGMNSG